MALPMRCAAARAPAQRRSTSSSAAAALTCIRGIAAFRDTCGALGLPYRFFGFDSGVGQGHRLRARRRFFDEAAAARSRPTWPWRRNTRPRHLVPSPRRGAATMRGRTVAPWPAHVGIASLAQIATHKDRVYVLDLRCASSNNITPSAMPSAAATSFSAPLRPGSGQVSETMRGSIPVYDDVREGLDAGHRFYYGVVYLHLRARDGVAELIHVDPELRRSSSSPRSSRCTVWRRDPRHRSAARDQHLAATASASPIRGARSEIEARSAAANRQEVLQRGFVADLLRAPATRPRPSPPICAWQAGERPH